MSACQFLPRSPANGERTGNIRWPTTSSSFGAHLCVAPLHIYILAAIVTANERVREWSERTGEREREIEREEGAFSISHTLLQGLHFTINCAFFLTFSGAEFPNNYNSVPKTG